MFQNVESELPQQQLPEKSLITDLLPRMQEAADDEVNNEDAVSSKDYLMGIESDIEMEDDVFGSSIAAQERQMPFAQSAEEEEKKNSQDEEEKNSQEEEKSPMANDQSEAPQTGLDIPSLAQM